MEDNPYKKQICRLCLNIVAAGDAEAIGEKKMTILEVLLMNVDLHLTENAVACSRCMEEIQSGFEFKSACLHVDNCVSTFVEADMRGTEMANINLKNRRICQLCMSLIPEEALHCNTDDLKDLTANCLPEVVIFKVHEPLVCGLCFSRMKKLNEFMTTCQEVERRINNYCQAVVDHAIPISVSLNDLFKFEASTINGLVKEEYSNFDSITLKKEDIDSIECEEIHLKADLESGDEMGDSIPSGASKNSGKSDSLKRKTQIRQFPSKGSNHVSSDGHMARHGGLTKEFACQQCTFKTDKKYLLAGHMVTHKDKSEVDLHKCEICEYETKYKRCMIPHMMKHRDPKAERKFKCDKCPYETNFMSSLCRHNLKHMDKLEMDMLKCHNCGYETMYKSSMKEHMVRHRDPKAERIFKCDKCPYETNYKYHLCRHNLLIHMIKSELLKCDDCEYETMYKGDMRKHMVKHRHPKGERKFKCDKCPYETNYKSHLCRHNLLIHVDKSEVEMHKCGNCEYAAKQKSDLRKHMLKHRDPKAEKKFKCDKCPYEMDIKSSLRSHNLRHKDKSEVKMHKCENCEYETRYKSAIIQHRAKHRDLGAERKFKCDKCPYETNYNHNLCRHNLLIHMDTSEVEMHKCDNCEYATKRKSNLKNHMLKHDLRVEKKFKCDKCPYETNQKHHLNQHNLIHMAKSEVEMHKCEYCQFETRYRSNLNQHVLKHRDTKMQRKI